jgi:hypothetical protein
MGKAVVDATLASGRENEIVDALSWFLNGDKEMARHMLGIGTISPPAISSFRGGAA